MTTPALKKILPLALIAIAILAAILIWQGASGPGSPPRPAAPAPPRPGPQRPCFP